MISSGIRISSWMYLKWKHFKSIERNGEIVGAKFEVVLMQRQKKLLYF